MAKSQVSIAKNAGVHRLSYAFVLGYHGCYVKVAERLLRGEPLKKSNNDYDWLGPGAYFWEANPQRGLDFAREKAIRSKSTDECTVVGAVIDLGDCLDLTTTAGIRFVDVAHKTLAKNLKDAGEPMLINIDTNRPKLDCAVIRTALAIDDRIQTVKGMLPEGGALYETSNFSKKTHVQISVVDLSCVKGIFRVDTSTLS